MLQKCYEARLKLTETYIIIGRLSFQVEYTPCVVVADCWSLLIEFMQGFLGNQTLAQPNVLANKKDAPYTPMDTVTQYLEHFNHFRKSQGGR